MDNAQKYIGKIIDKRYHIQRIIGVGGMAIVYEAIDIVLNRTVAFKMLKDEMSDDEESVKRFINESKAVSMLSHPNIVKIFDVSVNTRMKYIVMERIEGITLKSYMQKKGALSTDEVLSYTEQVLKALEHAHSKGIVHRDIKPQNILLLKNGRVKVTDFGIAVLPSSKESPNGKAIGTVYYISPEQVNGRETDARSDLYSLGIMMYEMATGTLPFNADTPISVALMQVREQPTPPSEINNIIPTGLEQIILGLMEKSPERRFQSASQVLKYIEKLKLNPDYIFKTRDSSSDIETDDYNMKRKKSYSRRKNQRPQSKSMFPIVLGVSIAFAIVLIISAIIVLDKVLTTENANAPETIIVPNVVGQMYDEDRSKEMLDPAYFTFDIQYVHDQSPVGTIVGQSPSGSSKKKIQKGITYCHVKLKVSRGAELASVPDLTTMEYRKAKIYAEELGFKVKIVDYVSEIYGVGVVAKTSPQAKQKVEFGSTITIYKSIGPEYTKVKAENYVGTTPRHAYTKINGDFKIGAVTYEYSNITPTGCIISQNLVPNTMYIKYTTINFVISLGPPPETTEPDVTAPEETGPNGDYELQ